MLEADLNRHYQDAQSGADIILDDVPTRIQAICEIAPNLPTEARHAVANRLDIIYQILDDIGAVLNPTA